MSKSSERRVFHIKVFVSLPLDFHYSRLLDEMIISYLFLVVSDLNLATALYLVFEHLVQTQKQKRVSLHDF